MADANNGEEVPLLETSNTNHIKKSATTKLNRRILPIIFTIQVLMVMLRNNIIFVAGEFCDYIHLTYFEYALGASFYTTAFFIFITPSISTLI